MRRPSCSSGITAECSDARRDVCKMTQAARERLRLCPTHELECVNGSALQAVNYPNTKVYEGELMSMKKIGLAAVMMLLAVSAMASNFRAADQVYLPAAGKDRKSTRLNSSHVRISYA